MGFIRLLAAVFLLFATLSVAGDVTRARTATSGGLATLDQTWKALAPQSHAATQSMVGRVAHPRVWDGVVMSVLTLPASVVLGALGLGLAWIGRRRRGANIFAN